jgi:hypothetical protein
MKQDKVFQLILSLIKIPAIKSLLEKQPMRVWKEIKALYIWHTYKGRKFPLLITGKSGSGKSFIARKFFEGILNIENIVYCIPPESGSYRDYIKAKIESLPEEKIEMVIIDEAHELGLNIEAIQPHSSGLQFGEYRIPYSKLIFISHSGIGSNNSEDSRLENVHFDTPEREEIIELLTMFEGFEKEKAIWSAWHAPRSFHKAITIGKYFGTDLQGGVLPCGLSPLCLEILSFYKDSSEYSNNTINSCAGKLGFDVNAIKNAERALKEESLLIVGKQSKRELTEQGLDLLYTLKERELERVKSELELEPTPPTPPKAKVTPPKAKRKAPKSSKFDNIKPDKSPSELYAEISSQIVKPADPLAKLD